MYSRILVPLDGSRLAEQVLPYAQLLGSRFGSQLDILQVVPVADGDQNRQIARSNQYIQAISGRLKSNGLAVTARAIVGDVSEQINNEARNGPSTLIAMSTCGHSGLVAGKLGNVVEGVLGGTTNPLMIIRPCPEETSETEVQLDTVIVPLDGSLLAEQVLSSVVQLAKALALKISLVQVTPTAGSDENLIFEYPDSQSGEDLVDVDVKAEEYLQQVGLELRRLGVKRVAQHILHNDPAVAIVEFARQIPHNLVAMTTHGGSGLGPWPLGSVTELVERHCGTPVLVIRPTHDLSLS